MNMVFCRGCGKQIHETAPMCPTCGAPQGVPVATAVSEREGVVAGGKTANGMALRPQEVNLFEGDVVLLKSKINVSQTQALITNQRLFVSDGGLAVEKKDVELVTEEKHGLAVKMVFKLRDGRILAMTAADRQTFVAAAKVLAGQADMNSMPKQPKLSNVKNGTAWLAAFGPLIAALITMIVGTIMWGNMTHWRTTQDIQALLLRVALMYLFLRIDYLKLQSQGYNVKQLGLADPMTLPLYLFSRAQVFKSGKGPAITWCVLVVIDILLAFMG